MPSPTRSSFRAWPALLALAATPAIAQVAMPDAAAMMDPTAAVARLSDAEAGCEQLYAEATHLEGTIAAMPRPEDPAALAMKMQADMRDAQKKMIAGQRARSMGASLLSLVPGGGMVAGAVSSLGGRGSTATMDKAINASMQAQQESVQAMMAASRLQARQDYVTRLFVERGCRPSQLDGAAVASARSALAGGSPDASGSSVAAAPAIASRTDPRGEPVPQAPMPETTTQAAHATDDHADDGQSATAGSGMEP
jgi:hypothetical protein